jgi:hypothetical protein
LAGLLARKRDLPRQAPRSRFHSANTRTATAPIAKWSVSQIRVGLPSGESRVEYPLTRGAASFLDPCRAIDLFSLKNFSLRLDGSWLHAQPQRICANGRAWSCFCTNSRRCPTPWQVLGSTCIPTGSDCGDNAGLRATLPSTTLPGEAASPSFPPLDRAIVVSIACDVVARTGNPLSRQSTADLTKRAQEELNKPISRSTVWKILDADAIKPWQYEHWIFPRAANFFEKAAVVLDLYEGYWQGERIDPFDRIISSDEKTSIQARIRTHTTLPPGPGRRRRVEHEYERGGALQYLAAWDVQLGRVMGRCEAKTGIEPFGRLVKQVMEHPDEYDRTLMYEMKTSMLQSRPSRSLRGTCQCQRRSSTARKIP